MARMRTHPINRPVIDRPPWSPPVYQHPNFSQLALPSEDPNLGKAREERCVLKLPHYECRTPSPGPELKEPPVMKRSTRVRKPVVRYGEFISF